MLPALGLTIRMSDVGASRCRVEARNEEYGIAVMLNETGQIVVLPAPDWP